ncbi:hypothetical protein [Brenneria uluponensis]|uniref:hypothetical protein n=1 Tax=Brenneria uluponensis TaxID=3057057 RepID=UPI0028E8277A|nr:hypothetical protein [Brenneria ulupoensis]
MKKAITIFVLSVIVAGYASAASTSSAPCRSTAWNDWVESQVKTQNKEIGSISWQQQVEQQLRSTSKKETWPTKNSVLWCIMVQKKLAAQ